MSNHSNLARGGLAAAALLALSAGVAAAQPAAAGRSDRAPCFFITQWNGWKSPSPDVLYLGVNNRDVYRVDLSVGSSQLQWPGMHLVSISRGSSSICTALDLDLKISDTNGFKQPLIARKLTKLTPEEVAEIPRKYRPF